MGHIPHLRKQFKSINTYDYYIVDKEKKKNHNLLSEDEKLSLSTCLKIA